MFQQIGLDFCILRRCEIFPRGREPEVDGRRRWRLSSEITARKSTIVHLVCVIVMYTIYKVYKDVALSCSSYAIFLECRGSWWRKRSAGGVLKWVQCHPAYRGMTCSSPIIRFSHRHVYSDNCRCLIEWHSGTMAVIWLSCACKRTDSYYLGPVLAMQGLMKDSRWRKLVIPSLCKDSSLVLTRFRFLGLWS